MREVDLKVVLDSFRCAGAAHFVDVTVLEQNCLDCVPFVPLGIITTSLSHDTRFSPALARFLVVLACGLLLAGSAPTAAPSPASPMTASGVVGVTEGLLLATSGSSTLPRVGVCVTMLWVCRARW